MLIITGANGKLGRLVVEKLLERVPASDIGVSVREPEKAKALTDRGVRVRPGDFADPSALRHAFEGARRVLVISSNTSGAEAVAHHRNAIEAAKAVGVERIFYTSHVGSSSTSLFAPMVDHAATEVVLRESGLRITVLRNGFYADSARLMIGGPELRLPADGPVSWTAHSDLAEATATLMRNDGPAENVTVNLTAAEALDMNDIAALLGKPRVVISEAEYRDSLVAFGVPAERASMFVGLFLASRRGEFARVDPALAELLGRAPTPLREVLAA